MILMTKWVFAASLLTWAAGGVWIMSSGGKVTFDMFHATPVLVHHVAGVLTLGLGLILLVRWMWIKLYS